ncbi:MAG: hypothetical protein J1F40_01875 [Prevotellaceae bacterium]|nr:hypothetical protein [Prevotellaceae bacterium]
MNRLFKMCAACAALALPFMANAQDKVEATVGADLVSNYIWRGQDMGSAAIQPSVGVAYKGLSLTAWGSYGFVSKDDTKELDFTLAYSVGGFTVGITDYYCVNGSSNCPVKYFLYDANKTAHVFEANVGYDFGILSLNWFTNFAGADGQSKSGKRAYSSYVEVGVPFTFGGIEWGFTLGAVPYATDYYADASGFAVTNVSLQATKEIKITPTFSLPLFGAITANPSTQSLFFTAGVSF